MDSTDRTTAVTLRRSRFPAHRQLLLLGGLSTVLVAALVAWLASEITSLMLVNGADAGALMAGDRVRHALELTAAVFAVGGVALFIAIDRTLTRWVDRPAGALARAAEAVADGNLSMPIEATGRDNVARLGQAMGRMVSELRRLAGALGSSSSDTTRLAGEISSAAEELAAGAGEMARTAGELSDQSAAMATSIQAITSAASHLAGLAAELDGGAQEAAERNRRLRQLALENRARLDESSGALVALSGEASAGVAAVEALVTASEEVRTFVTLVRKLARQSKLLALNAAMEAARAGEEGEGFAVVADEVRRLAATSADAAERTERVVERVLSQIQSTRDWSRRTESTVRQVSDVTATGAASFAQIQQAVDELDEWTGRIESSAGDTHRLTNDITAQLASLSLGTETFASAMEEVAASSQEQSAATEEVAAAAANLISAAERLADLVSNLRLDATPGRKRRLSGGAPVETERPLAAVL